MITPARGTNHSRAGGIRHNFSGRWSAILASAAAIALSAAGEPEPIITPARMQEIRARAMLRPEPVEIVQQTAVPLDLTSPGVPYLTKQAIFTTPQQSHHFAVHAGSSSKVLIMQIEGQNVQLWVCDMNASLISAAVITGGKIEMRSIAQAKAAFEAEMHLWAIVPRFTPKAADPSPTPTPSLP